MNSYLQKCQKHLQSLFSATSSNDGSMWPSVVNTQTGRWDKNHVPQRVYRLIGAPQGSTLYWDQPSLVAAYELSKLSGDYVYAEAANGYVDDFLSHCVGDNGMFRWGNHAYFDLVCSKIVEFQNGYHELRPITPAWDVFWRQDPEKTAKYIRTMVKRHLYDPATGGFNRHDDGKKSHAFIESGGILAESLTWLYAKTGEGDLLETALRIARYSYSHRNPTTGLIPNEPDFGRWDSKVCTSEIGLWAQCLLRAADYSQNNEFTDMARHAVRAYLDFAYDNKTGQYFGQVSVSDGMPVIPEETGYWPRKYANFWNRDQWPNHDYPASVAESCLSLYQQTGESSFLEDVRRLSMLAAATSPGQTGNWAYAESYGRCIHFLARAGLELDDKNLLNGARALADEAVERLWDKALFQGYPGSRLYESVDGVGYLMLACILVETGQQNNLNGFCF